MASRTSGWWVSALGLPSSAGRKQDRGHLNSDHVSLLNTSAFKSIFVQSPVSSTATAPQQSGFPSGPSSERFLPDPGKHGLCVPDEGLATGPLSFFSFSLF